MDAADIPTKQPLVRTGKFAQVFDAQHDFSADEFNALRDGILALRGVLGGVTTWKSSCRVVIVANVALTGLGTYDGVALNAGDRVLVTGQTVGHDNGIWIAASGAWSRASDAASDAQVTCGITTIIEEGAVYAGTLWSLETPNPIVLGTTALMFVPQASNEASITLCDDDSFDDGSWFVAQKAFGADIKIAPSGASLSTPFPSSGIVLLSCSTTSGSEAMIVKAGCGGVLGTGAPLVIEWWSGKAYNGATQSDDECTWTLAAGSADGQNLVAVNAGLSGGVRAFQIATFSGGSPTIDTMTTPAAGAVYHWRLTITKSAHTLLEVSVDGAPYVSLGTSSVNPPLCVYQPIAFIAKDTGAGNRTLPIDRVRMFGKRAATDAGSFVDASLGLPVPFTGYGATSTTACVGNDSRLSDSRTPTSHGSTHTSTGGDPIPNAVPAGASGLMSGADKSRFDAMPLDNYGATRAPLVTDDNTQGYAPGSVWVWPGNGVWICGVATTGAAFWFTFLNLGNSTPQPLGTAAAGSSGNVSHQDHIHAMPRLDQVAVPTADVSLNSHKLTNVTNPASAQDAATRIYADQPNTRTDSTTTPAITAADIGGFIKLSNAGSITLSTLDLSASLRSGAAIIISVMVSGGGAVTIGDGSGCTHDGSVSGTSFVLWSDDGTTWLVR